VRRHERERRELPFDVDEVLLDLNDSADYARVRELWG
jgi:hypothetical protein